MQKGAHPLRVACQLCLVPANRPCITKSPNEAKIRIRNRPHHCRYVEAAKESK